jgi:hypothetical protein
VHIIGGILLLAAWLAFGLTAAAPPLADERPEPFTIGVLRRDGVISPFATFDGKEWTSPWPADLRSVDIPISLDGVPRKWWGKTGPLQRMTLWIGGERRGEVALERPAAVRIMCSPRLGFRSDYVSRIPAPEPGEQSYPKDGLVVSGATAVDPISQVPPSSPEWAASEALLPEPFDGAEKRAISAFTDWEHPLERSERPKVRVRLEALYKAPMDAPGWMAYRFQAEKHYAPSPADGNCGLISSASGWIVAGPNGKHWTQLLVRITYCDRMDDVFTLPLGVVRTGGRSYWVYQLSGYDREGYVISRPTPKAVDTPVQYPAGSCPE